LQLLTLLLTLLSKHVLRGKTKGGEKLTACNRFYPLPDAYAIFVSLKHLSHSHIMPRTLPVVVIIFAACMGFPQHWGTFRFATAFLVAAFAVLLISAMLLHLQVPYCKPAHFNRKWENVKDILIGYLDI